MKTLPDNVLLGTSKLRHILRITVNLLCYRVILGRCMIPLDSKTCPDHLKRCEDASTEDGDDQVQGDFKPGQVMQRHSRIVHGREKIATDGPETENYQRYVGDFCGQKTRCEVEDPRASALGWREKDPERLHRLEIGQSVWRRDCAVGSKLVMAFLSNYEDTPVSKNSGWESNEHVAYAVYECSQDACFRTTICTMPRSRCIH